VQKLASENIEVTGWVSDIQAYFTTSKILVAPMLISIGLQNKLLEAMAAGVPCVTSEMANNALKAQDQTQILVAKKPEEFATNIVNLLENKELYHTISNEAFRFVTENYSWNKVEELLNELLKKQKT
ncbi:MAG TPA: glycosyltransferase, partial [Chitinophagales bacterium]|nr:glycosyltransferase [Chitinophagales bacterium]